MDTNFNPVAERDNNRKECDMKSKYVIGGIVIGGNTIRMNGLGMQIDGDAPFTTLPGATVREANQKGDLPPMTAAAPTAAGAAIASNQGGYVSEVAQAVLGRWSADAQGRLIDGDGKVITEPENTDPWPGEYGDGTIDEQVARLFQFQFDHPFLRNQINIDAQDLGQPGDPTLPKFMLGTAGGKLRPRTDATVPAPVPVTVVPISSSTADQDVVLRIGAERQRLTRSKGLGTGIFRAHLVAPQIPSPTSPGFVRIAETPGSEVHNGELRLLLADGTLVTTAVGIAPSIGWSTVAGTDCIIAPGASFTAEYRHLDALSTTAPNDVICDVRNPA